MFARKISSAFFSLTSNFLEISMRGKKCSGATQCDMPYSPKHLFIPSFCDGFFRLRLGQVYFLSACALSIIGKQSSPNHTAP